MEVDPWEQVALGAFLDPHALDFTANEGKGAEDAPPTPLLPASAALGPLAARGEGPGIGGAPCKEAVAAALRSAHFPRTSPPFSPRPPTAR